MIYRSAKLAILEKVIEMIITITEFSQWNNHKVLTCKLCNLKNSKGDDFFKHLLSHLEFLHLFDANMGRCIDKSCTTKKQHKSK